MRKILGWRYLLIGLAGTNAFMGCFCFAGILLLLVYALIRFADSIDTSLYRWRDWLKWRRKNKSYSKTNRGLIELVEGNWRTAENYLLEGIDQSEAPLINYLGAAKAAQERGAYEKRDLYLRQAYHIAPQAKMAIGLTQAKLQFEQGQLEQALATLEQLLQIAPYHPVVVKLLQQTYIRLSDWKGLVKLLPHIRKADLLSLDQFEKLQKHVYWELLQANMSKPDYIKEIWQTLPRKLKKDPQFEKFYASI